MRGLRTVVKFRRAKYYLYGFKDNGLYPKTDYASNEQELSEKVVRLAKAVGSGGRVEVIVR